MNQTERDEKVLYSSGEVQAMFSITRKTLFYYDKTGLLKPSARKGSQEHKLYSPEDLERLSRILYYKRAGLKISEIFLLLDQPSCSESEILHKALVRITGEKNLKEHQILLLENMIRNLTK